MYALVDCNTFYASCEAIFRPDLWGKPIIVLSNNDGCIVARNAEAKALNIPDLVPYFQVRKQIQECGAHVFSSNYELYGDISSRVMAMLEDYGTEMEVYSIDEAFLRLPEVDYQEHSKGIKAMLWQNIHMPVCVGVAPTKTLSKLANRAAKKIKKLGGVCVLDTSEKWDWLLTRLPTQEVWGVGNRISARLQEVGIRTAYQLAKADPKWLRKRFSVVLERTIRELNGEACMDLELDPEPKKEIVCTRSFSYKITELSELQQAMCLYSARACEKLRAQDGLTKTLWVYLESFDGAVGHYRPSRVVSLPYLTNDTREIATVSSEAIVSLYREGIRYKKCGVGLLDVRTRQYDQSDLFSPQQSMQSRELMEAIDRVNRRYGKNTMYLANQGIRPNWSMKRDYKSPCYTTRWSEIPSINCK